MFLNSGLTFLGETINNFYNFGALRRKENLTLFFHDKTRNVRARGAREENWGCFVEAPGDSEQDGELGEVLT